jgi:hypothetical protein
MMGGRNTGNVQGRSRPGDGPGRFSWPGKVAEMDPEVAQALLNLAKRLPEGFSVDEAKLTCRAGDYQNAQGTSRAKLRYLLLSDLHDKLIELSAHSEKQAEFVRKLQKRQTIEWGFDLSSLIAQYYMKRSEERARRYAYVVCGAALKGIPAGELASKLGKNGITIDALAKLFTDRPKAPVRKALKLCKIDVFCSEEQLKRSHKLSGSKLRFFVQRRPGGKDQFDLDRCLAQSQD